MAREAAPQKDAIGNFMQSVSAIRGGATPSTPEAPDQAATAAPADPAAAAEAAEAPAGDQAQGQQGQEQEQDPGQAEEAQGQDQELKDLVAEISSGANPDDAASKLGALIDKRIAAATTGIVQSLPGVVHNLVADKVGQVNTYNKFFDDNKDLAAHREVVHAMASGVERDNPGKTPEEHMQLLADKVRSHVNPAKKASLPMGGGQGGEIGKTPAPLTGAALQKQHMADVVKKVRR